MLHERGRSTSDGSLYPCNPNAPSLCLGTGKARAPIRDRRRFVRGGKRALSGLFPAGPLQVGTRAGATKQATCKCSNVVAFLFYIPSSLRAYPFHLCSPFHLSTGNLYFCAADESSDHDDDAATGLDSPKHSIVALDVRQSLEAALKHLRRRTMSSTTKKEKTNKLARWTNSENPRSRTPQSGDTTRQSCYLSSRRALTLLHAPALPLCPTRHTLFLSKWMARRKYLANCYPPLMRKPSLILPLIQASSSSSSAVKLDCLARCSVSECWGVY